VHSIAVMIKAIVTRVPAPALGADHRVRQGELCRASSAEDGVADRRVGLQSSTSWRVVRRPICWMAFHAPA